MAATNKRLAQSNKNPHADGSNEEVEPPMKRARMKGKCRPKRSSSRPSASSRLRILVERGKRREEIAELIGVTVGSLQVTCSRLGISLRRPRLKPVRTPPSKPAKAADLARFAISLRYQGEERTTELPLTQDMITQLAVEAAFRGVSIYDLIGDLIMEMVLGVVTMGWPSYRTRGRR